LRRAEKAHILAPVAGETIDDSAEPPLSRTGTPSRSSPELRAACLVASIGGALALPFLAGISMLDEGALVHIADRIASGEVLYRDVATGVMPGSFYLHALLFLVFGRTLLLGRILAMVLFALTSVGVFLLARSVTRRGVALALALSFSALSVNFWRFPGYSSEAMCLVFLTLGAARAFLSTRDRKWLFLTGLGIGSTLLFKQNYGAFVSLGVAIGLAASARDVREGLRNVATAALVAALPVAMVAVLFAMAGAGAAFWRFTLGVPLQMPEVFSRPWPPLWGEPDARFVRDIIYFLPFEELALELREWLSARQWLTVAVVRVIFHLPLLLLAAAVFVWLRERFRRGRAALAGTSETRDLEAGALYLGTSAFLFLGVFPRVDAHHLFMAVAPCFVLAAWLAGREPRPFLRRVAGVVAGALLTLSLASQIAAIADVYPEQVRDEFLSLPRARVWVERWQAAEIRRHVEQIQTRVPEGEPIFVAPTAAMYYFLADRPNPTRFPLILPGAFDEEEALRALSEKPVSYALISDIAFESFPFQHVAPRVHDYLIRNYRPADGAGWEVAPHAPYLYSRGPRPLPATIEMLSRASSEDGAVLSLAKDYSSFGEVKGLIQPPLSPKPIFQTIATDEWRGEGDDLVDWQSTYLEPSLVVRAPGGWRKTLVSWEVPADPGIGFEFACALLPWAWAGWTEGQGAIVEVWVSSSPETAAPRRVWWRWINPRVVPEDRRWHRAFLDLSSFTGTGRAIVTLVVGSAPTFLATDGFVAWSGLRLIAPKEQSADFLDSLQHEPQNVRVAEGTARRILSFLEEDLAVFQSAAEQYSDLGSAHAALADVATSLGHHELALEAIRDAARVDPEYDYYWMRLGQELQHAGQWAEAVDAMGVALEMEPRIANYHAALASVLSSRPEGRERAIASTLEALRLDPENAWAYSLLALLERQGGNLEASARAAEQSIALEPNNAWPRLNLAETLQAMGQTEQALQSLERAALLDMDAGARSALARNLLACGRAQWAREEALRATAQDPSSSGNWIVLAQVESTLGQWEEAVRAWRQVAALDPANSSALVHLARALANSGRGSEALRSLAAAEAAAGDDPSRLREVAIVLDEVDRSDEAGSVWRRVAALAPEGELKEEARRRLGAPPGQ
jgi:superkiller protein 3